MNVAHATVQNQVTDHVTNPTVILISDKKKIVESNTLNLFALLLTFSVIQAHLHFICVFKLPNRLGPYSCKKILDIL